MARLKKEVIQAVSDNKLFRFVNVFGQSFLVSVEANFVAIELDGTVRQYVNKPEVIEERWYPSVDAIGFVTPTNKMMLITLGSDNKKATNETNAETQER